MSRIYVKYWKSAFLMKNKIKMTGFPMKFLDRYKAQNIPFYMMHFSFKFLWLTLKMEKKSGTD